VSWVAIFDQPESVLPGPWGTGVSGIPGGSVFGSAYGVGEALVEAVAAALEAGYGGPVGGNVLVGWPTANQLNQIVANGGGQVTVYPLQGTWKNADRYRPLEDVPVYDNPPQLTATVQGNVIILGGTVDQATNLEVDVVPFGSQSVLKAKVALTTYDTPQSAAQKVVTAIGSLGAFGVAGLLMTPTTVLVVGAAPTQVFVAPATVLTPVVNGSVLSFTGPASDSTPFGQPYAVHVLVGETRLSAQDAVVTAKASDSVATLVPQIAAAVESLGIGAGATVVGSTVHFTGIDYLACRVALQAHLVGEVGRVEGCWQVSVWAPDAYSRAQVEECIFESVGTLETPFLPIGTSAAAVWVRYAGGRAAGWVDRSQSDYGCYESHMNFLCEWPTMRAIPATQVGASKPTLAVLGGTTP